MLRNKILYFGQRLIERGGQRGAWYFAPFSLLYALAIFCRNKLYDWHCLPVTKVKATVVSVGNIVAGGTGKTPFVALLAERFSHKKVAILSRGYGEVPDEALLLARRLPHAKVHVGKNRAALAKTIDADLIILDDGFQHRKLHRDIDVVLGPATGRYLPWGFLRDSPQRVKNIEWHFESELRLSVKRILDCNNQEIPSIRGWKVALFCAIAKPQNFKKTVEGLGAEVVAEKYFADHEVPNLSKLPKASVLLCTEKDFVKLPPNDLPIYYLEMEMIGSGKKWEMLIEKIDQKIDNNPDYE